MRHPIMYTFLGFHFNSLLDEKEELSYFETTNQIKNGTLFSWLKNKFGERLDVSLFSEDDLKTANDFFESLLSAVDSRRKFGVEKNGLCLLVAYCFEAAQRNEIDM